MASAVIGSKIGGAHRIFKFNQLTREYAVNLKDSGGNVQNNQLGPLSIFKFEKPEYVSDDALFPIVQCCAQNKFHDDNPTYELTKHTVFKAGTTYYTYNSTEQIYEEATVTVGDPVPADTYYTLVTAYDDLYTLDYKKNYEYYLDSFALTSHTTFQEKTKYYTYDTTTQTYQLADVTVGATVPANTYFVTNYEEDSLNIQSLFSVATTGVILEAPIDGFGTAFDDCPIFVNLSSAIEKLGVTFYVRYKFVTRMGQETEWHVVIFPTSDSVPISRLATIGYPASIKGSVATLSSIKAITNGTLIIEVDGEEQSLSGLNFSQCSTMDKVAEYLQKKIEGVDVSVTSDNRIVITSLTIGDESDISYATGTAASTLGLGSSQITKTEGSNGTTGRISGYEKAMIYQNDKNIRTIRETLKSVDALGAKWKNIDYSASVSLDLSANGNLQKMTLEGNLAIISPTLNSDEQTLLFQFDCGGQSRTVLLDGATIYEGVGVKMIGFYYDGNRTRRHALINVY